MARRNRSADAEGLNLDSLMDALTNVVAVLILILILLQVDVGQTVDRILGNLKPATEREIAAASSDLAKARKDLARQREALEAPPPTPEQIAKIRADLALLDKDTATKQAKLLEHGKLVDIYNKTKAEADAELAKTNKLLEEIKKLTALLDQTPVPKAPAATVVRIPDSRDIPQDANIYYCVIRDDIAHLVDLPTAKAEVMREFDRRQRELFRELVKVKGKSDRRIYDQDKVVKHFAALNLNVRNQKVTVPYNRPWTRLNVRIDIDPKKGDATRQDIETDKGRFHAICNKVSSYPRRVLIFKVHPNSFAAYLKAREIADQYRIPCGWEIDANTAFSLPLDFEVNRLEEPPKPQPGAAPPKPGPKRKLD
ncbi:MAG: hypothetical protein J0M04_12105 [Verrucomicrobia bacterium]|nr:hypothetical protein [Verrucomicrobiota bacterium]